MLECFAQHKVYGDLFQDEFLRRSKVLGVFQSLRFSNACGFWLVRRLRPCHKHLGLNSRKLVRYLASHVDAKHPVKS